jgi:hypothetical protein
MPSVIGNSHIKTDNPLVDVSDGMPTMTPRDDESSTGPLLVLLVGIAFTVAMVVHLFAQFRYVLGGTSTQATVRKVESGTAEMTFRDEAGEEHVLRGKPSTPVDVGDTVAIRYLTGDPAQVRLEEEVGPAWRWGMLWVLLGLGATGFGVLLVWGRHPGRWRPGRPGER